MNDRQQLEAYTRARTELVAKRDALDDRIEELDTVIGGLRRLLGERPRNVRTSTKATGTKALILDVLADGQRQTLRGIAAAAQVNPSSVAKHLRTLVAAGDVDQAGKSRATTYGIPRRRA